MSMPAVVEPYWVVICWNGRVFAGPGGPGGPPWLFIDEAHARTYAGQLQAAGMEPVVKPFAPTVLEWQGKSLVQVPAIPPPDFYADDGAQHTNASESSASEPQANGAPNGTPLAPPPDLE